MNKLLLLTPLLCIQTIYPHINHKQAEALADKAYSIFMTAAQTRDKQAIDTFTASSECVALQAALKKALEADNNATRAKIMEPVIAFGKRLQQHCCDANQMIKDCNAQDARAIEQITFGTINNYAYYEMLKAYGFAQAFVYTLGELNAQQQEIAELVYKIRDAAWRIIKKFATENKRTGKKNPVRGLVTLHELEAFKQSPLIAQLKKELEHANTLQDNWIEAEKAAANVRFFIHMLDSQLTDSVTFFKKYAINAERKTFITWLFNNFQVRQILSLLEFEL